MNWNLSDHREPFNSKTWGGGKCECLHLVYQVLNNISNSLHFLPVSDCSIPWHGPACNKSRYRLPGNKNPTTSSAQSDSALCFFLNHHPPYIFTRRKSFKFSSSTVEISYLCSQARLTNRPLNVYFCISHRLFL